MCVRVFVNVAKRAYVCQTKKKTVLQIINMRSQKWISKFQRLFMQTFVCVCAHIVNWKQKRFKYLASFARCSVAFFIRWFFIPFSHHFAALLAVSVVVGVADKSWLTRIDWWLCEKDSLSGWCGWLREKFRFTSAMGRAWACQVIDIFIDKSRAQPHCWECNLVCRWSNSNRRVCLLYAMVRKATRPRTDWRTYRWWEIERSNWKRNQSTSQRASKRRKIIAVHLLVSTSHSFCGRFGVGCSVQTNVWFHFSRRGASATH